MQQSVVFIFFFFFLSHSSACPLIFRRKIIDLDRLELRGAVSSKTPQVKLEPVPFLVKKGTEQEQRENWKKTTCERRGVKGEGREGNARLTDPTRRLEGFTEITEGPKTEDEYATSVRCIRNIRGWVLGSGAEGEKRTGKQRERERKRKHKGEKKRFGLSPLSGTQDLSVL